MMPIMLLQESPRNPRKRFDPAALRELSDSIARHGIVTPLLARPVVDGMYELAAGHRRHRAALIAGLSEVPCIVREMDDITFLEILTVENLQREGVHPLEEAAGYHELRECAGYDVAAIADKIGRSEAYVHGRLRLLNLTVDAQAEFLDGNISFGHARILSSLSTEKQAEGLKICFEERGGRRVTAPVIELKSWVEDEEGEDLSDAPFDLADASLLQRAGSCLACPKSSCVTGRLFADSGEDDLCFDRKCYAEKVSAFVARQIAAGVVPVSRGEKVAGALAFGQFVRLGGPSDCACAEASIEVGVYQKGMLSWICRDSACATHARPSSESDGSAVSAESQSLKAVRGPSLEELQRQQEQKKASDIRAEVFRQVTKLWEPEVPDAMLRTMLLLAVVGQTPGHGDYYSEMARHLGLKVPSDLSAWEANKAARKAVFGHCVETSDGALLKRLLLDYFEDEPEEWQGRPDALKILAEDIGVSFELVEKQLFPPVKKSKKTPKAETEQAPAKKGRKVADA